MAGAIRERREDYYGKSDVVKYMNNKEAASRDAASLLLAFASFIKFQLLPAFV